MLKHKSINTICWVVVALAVVVAVLFCVAASLGWIEADNSLGYENRLFDTSRVHTIDIVMDDWAGFIDTITMEEYTSCTIIIDGEKYSNVGIRGKGNTSMSQVSSYGNDRYSFKVEFDQYNSGGSYYGLDKISLNNIISDNTYMKDYLSYQMMNYVGVASSLSSYVYITVYGEDWGLYLAVEAVEDGFLQRNYGTVYGNLYKPDSLKMGGGRGNGADFNMDDFMNEAGDESDDTSNSGGAQPPSGFDPSTIPDGFDPPAMSGSENMPDDFDPSVFGGEGGGMGGMFGGSSDINLQYIDDDPDSYPNIFDSAKTDITDTDKTRLIASLKQLSAGENVDEVVDVEAVIKYLVAHSFVCNNDSYTGMMVHNYYLYEEDGVLSMLPWDYNLAFGGMSMGGFGGEGCTSDVNSPIDTPVTGGTLESRPMVAWIFHSEEYIELYHQYYAEFIKTYFESGYFAQMIDETIALISPYVEKDPTAFCSYDDFLLGSSTVREWCLLRAESISGQLDGSIPSTQSGQSADSSALIDASHISAADMGEFDNGANGGGFGGTPDVDEWSAGSMPPNYGSETTSESGADNTNEDQNQTGGEGFNGNFDISDMPDSFEQSSLPEEFDTSSLPEGFDASSLPEGFDPSDIPEGADRFNMPDSFDVSARPDRTSTGNGETSIETWLLLGGCVFVLLVGVLIAKRYKR